MIVECIFSTLDEKGEPNFAPMGVLWGEQELVVRPFRQTRTYQNLVSSGYGVASLTDDVRAYVQSGLYGALLPHFPAAHIPGVVYQGACSWRELQVIAENGPAERPEMRCRVLGQGWQRDFLGFCRARGAVIEAAILATRLHLRDLQPLLEEMDRYEEIVEKTGDPAEKQAFQDIRAYIRRWLDENRG